MITQLFVKENLGYGIMRRNNMKVLKAGCIVINNNKKVALIYRDNRDDYSFPKGHLERNESLIECAIRETEEEIKRVPIILNNEPVAEEIYYDSNNDESIVSYYIARDGGKSNNTSEDYHKLIWTNIEDVEGMLSYPNLKKIWNKAKKEIEKII